MAVGYWVLIGGFVGGVCGFAVVAGDILLHYHYPFNPHYDMYPLPITIGNVAGADGIMCIIPGAIVGGIIGVRVRSAQAHHRESAPKAKSHPGVWPPPPTV